jgi:hypothetical protein
MTATHKFPMPTVSFDLTSSALELTVPARACSVKDAASSMNRAAEKMYVLGVGSVRSVWPGPRWVATNRLGPGPSSAERPPTILSWPASRQSVKDA